MVAKFNHLDEQWHSSYSSYRIVKVDFWIVAAQAVSVFRACTHKRLQWTQLSFWGLACKVGRGSDLKVFWVWWIHLYLELLASSDRVWVLGFIESLIVYYVSLFCSFFLNHSLWLLKLILKNDYSSTSIIKFVSLSKLALNLAFVLKSWP